nr:hypothetical protein [Lactobacillus sp.]
MLALKTCDTIFGNSCNFLGKEAFISSKKQKIKSSPNLCVKYFSQAQVVQGMRMHPCLSTITLEGAVKGAPSAHLEEV